MIFEKLRELLADQFGVDAEEITLETNLIEDFDADSIDIVDFMMAVEEEFEIGEVEESALEKLKTVGDVVSYIKERV